MRLRSKRCRNNYNTSRPHKQKIYTLCPHMHKKSFSSKHYVHRRETTFPKFRAATECGIILFPISCSHGVRNNSFIFCVIPRTKSTILPLPTQTGRFRLVGVEPRPTSVNECPPPRRHTTSIPCRCGALLRICLRGSAPHEFAMQPKVCEQTNAADDDEKAR